MNLLLRLLVTALAVVFLSKILPGVTVEGYLSAIIVAIVIALLRLIVRPILVLLTLPLTIITLGLFLFIVNGIIILMAGYFIDGFAVENIWWALLFSILLSFLQSVLYGLFEKQNK